VALRSREPPSIPAATGRGNEPGLRSVYRIAIRYKFR
jgi:hypothetical protein